MNPNDEVRMAVLNFFYERNKSARHDNGSEIDRARLCVKLAPRFSKEDVSSAILYLLDEGFLKKRVDTQTFKGYTTRVLGGKTQNTTIKTDKYRISSKGIDEFEHGSRFKRKHTLELNPTNIHMENSVANIGSGNVMGDIQLHTSFQDFSSLKELVTKSTELTDETKSDLCGDIDTVRTQLRKSNPNKPIIQAAWASVCKLATIQGAAGFVERIGGIIDGLI